MYRGLRFLLITAWSTWNGYRWRPWLQREVTTMGAILRRGRSMFSCAFGYYFWFYFSILLLFVSNGEIFLLLMGRFQLFVKVFCYYRILLFRRLLNAKWFLWLERNLIVGRKGLFKEVIWYIFKLCRNNFSLNFLGRYLLKHNLCRFIR